VNDGSKNLIYSNKTQLRLAKKTGADIKLVQRKLGKYKLKIKM
jgi:hypothetical protein